jgi:hypothetical protein
VVSILGNGVYGPLTYFFLALAFAAFVVEAWALVDALMRPKAAFAAAATMGDNWAQRLAKQWWLVILGIAAVIGLAAVVGWGGLSAINFIAILAFVAAAVYLAAVRPRVREYTKRGSRSSGPYGGW